MFKLSNSPSKFRIFRPNSRITILPTQNPTQPQTGNNYELGIRFRSTVAGQIIAVRHWKHSNDVATHIGRIWSDAGTLLASATFTSETSSGWQEQELPVPVNVSAETFYRASVNSINGAWFTAHGFDSQIQNLNLIAPVGAGVYASAGVGNFPNLTFNNTNYFRDIVFIPS